MYNFQQQQTATQLNYYARQLIQQQQRQTQRPGIGLEPIPDGVETVGGRSQFATGEGRQVIRSRTGYKYYVG
jgi:hypothetical protein